MGNQLNIYQRINKVMKSVAYVQKDANVQGYKAVTHDQVTAALRSALVDNGVIITPKVVESRTVDTGNKTSSGRIFIRYEARIDVSFVNVDDPKDLLIVTTEAHAEDTGDKAPGKALSYAVKYAMLKTFSLETGENDESRVANEGEKPITAQMFKTLKKLLEDSKSNESDFINFLQSQWGHEVDLANLTIGQFNWAISALNKKVAKNGTAQH